MPKERADRVVPTPRDLFYPATCHPVLTRRQLLLGMGALLAAPLIHGRSNQVERRADRA